MFSDLSKIIFVVVFQVEICSSVPVLYSHTINECVVGLSIEATSDGFIVDNTPPVNTAGVVLNSRLGSLNLGTQVLLSRIIVKRRIQFKSYKGLYIVPNGI